MSTRNVHKRLGSKIAKEMQLITEEKWILDALSKIKKQRNCLQIERLQLESLKAELNSSGNAQKSERTSNAEETSSTLTNTPSSTLDLMQSKRAEWNSGKCNTKIEENNFEIDCNTEELNLLVTTPVLKRPPNMNAFTEEEESDDEDDNVMIDINMLMNGLQDGNTECDRE